MIYLDNNSTTKPRPEVIEAMMPYLTDKWYNPSSPYEEGRKVAQDIEDARAFFAKSINAESPDEIIFVSCGSEANNMALRCLNVPNLSIITDDSEHHSILNCLGENTYMVSANWGGAINVDKLVSCLETIHPAYTGETLPKDVLISSMWINNELGVINPIKMIGDIAYKYNAYFHVDAVQAYGKIPIDVQKCHIDMLSVSSHKIGAPRGSGFLYVRKGTPLKPLIYGGQQENYMRAGTENVAGIMGFKKAAEIAMASMDDNREKLQKLHDYFVTLLDQIYGVSIINRDMVHFPSTISVYCGVPAEAMVAYLDEFNIAVSSGSACNSKDDKPSHVLIAQGMTDEDAGKVIRFSLSPDITFDQLHYVTEILKAGIRILGG